MFEKVRQNILTSSINEIRKGAEQKQLIKQKPDSPNYEKERPRQGFVQKSFGKREIEAGQMATHIYTSRTPSGHVRIYWGPLARGLLQNSAFLFGCLFERT